MTVEVWPSSEVLAAKIADRITTRLAEVQRAGRRPSIVLTGGTIAIEAYRQIGPSAVNWADVDIYWGDERFVPQGHADRNDQQARDAFLTRLGVPESCIHPMPAHGCEQSMAEAADGYAAGLPQAPFDLVLLGMGPDGHVASLFPGFPQLGETQRLAVEVFDSPKPPAQRISLTYPALNHAESVWLLVSGEAKADVVALALGGADKTRIPASGIRARSETLWLLDQDAAKEITA